MKLTLLGTATITVENEKGKILFDPFLRRNPRLKNTTPIVGFIGYDAIFITHGHFDHLYDVPEILRLDKKVPVFCTKTPAQTLMKKGVPAERIHIIEPGDVVEVKGMKVRAYPGRHVDFDFGYIKTVIARCTVKFPLFFKQVYLNFVYPEAEEILIYEIQENGKNILVTGSFGYKEDVEYPKNPDCFVLAHGGCAGIPQLARPLVESLNPKTVFITHHDDAFPPVTKAVKVRKVSEEFRTTHPWINFVIPEEKDSIEI